MEVRIEISGLHYILIEGICTIILHICIFFSNYNSQVTIIEMVHEHFTPLIQIYNNGVNI